MTVEVEAEVMIRRRNEMVDSVDRSAGSASTFWAVNNDQPRRGRFMHGRATFMIYVPFVSLNYKLK